MSKKLNVRYILSPKAAEICEYSIEAGKHDGIKHFDHHREHVGNPSPGNNDSIQVIKSNEVVRIGLTHFDTDADLGGRRLEDLELPNINLDTMEMIDLNGPSVVEPNDRTLLYMIGSSQFAKEVRFPTPNPEKEIDVTDYVNKLRSYNTEECIQKGIESQILGKENAIAKRVLLDESGKVGLWKLDYIDSFDAAEVYNAGIEIIVMSSENLDGTRRVVLLADNTSNHVLGGKTFSGVSFNGHDKACGSPWGLNIDFSKAEEIFKEVVKSLQ